MVNMDTVVERATMVVERIGWVAGIAVMSGISTLSPMIQAQDEGAQAIPVTGRLLNFELSPDGRTLATYENHLLFQIMDTSPEEADLRIGLVDVESGEAVSVGPFSTPASAVAFSPDGNCWPRTIWTGTSTSWKPARASC